MSAPTKSRRELIDYIRAQVAEQANPRLTVSEVSVLVRFHRRTLQRYIEEGLIPGEYVGPTRRVYLRWDQIRKNFPEDTRGI